MSIFFPHQSCCMKAVLRLERHRYAYFIRYLPFSFTIIRHQLQEPRTIEKSYRKSPFSKEINEELPNPPVVKSISENGLRCSENLANFVSSTLAGQKVLRFLGLGFFQCKLPRTNTSFHSLHDVFPGCNSICRSSL